MGPMKGVKHLFAIVSGTTKKKKKTWKNVFTDDFDLEVCQAISFYQCLPREKKTKSER